MLYDRPYMRSVPGRRHVSYLYWILGVTAAGFVVQNVAAVWLGQGRFILKWFSLGMGQILSGKVWTLLTYSLLHGGIGHLFFNCLALFLFGRALLPLISEKRLLQVYLLSVLAGGLAYLAVHYRGDSYLIGASAGVSGILTIFCLLQMDRPITFLIFFVIPVTLKPRWILWGTLAINAFGFLFTEMPRTLQKAPAVVDDLTGYSAHLGGMLAGWLFFRYVLNSGFSLMGASGRKMNIEPPEWLKRKPRTAKASRGFKLNMSSRADLKQEVDRILDKINTKGFGALSDEEKQTLDRAKDILKD